MGEGKKLHSHSLKHDETWLWNWKRRKGCSEEMGRGLSKSKIKKIYLKALDNASR